MTGNATSTLPGVAAEAAATTRGNGTRGPRRVARTFDVIGAVGACYAEVGDHQRWLEGLLESVRPLDDGGGAVALLFGFGEDGRPVIERDAGTGALGAVRARMGRLLSPAAGAEIAYEFISPSPPV